MRELAAIGIVVLVAALIVFGPFFFIWALNTLFGLGIAYTFKTWCASLILSGMFGKAPVNIKK